MFFLNKNIELDIELLNKMITRFNVEVKPRIQRYKDYYDGKHKILEKKYKDKTRLCSRVATSYPKCITDSFVGYIASPGFISYSSSNDIEELMDILRYNDYQEEDSNFLLNALIYGTAAELMYIDGDKKTRFKLINPTQCFGVYDDSLTNDLLYFVRFYPINEWDETDNYAVDVYSDYDIKHYIMRGENGQLEFMGEEPHYFSQCPCNIFSLPDEKSIFDCVMPLVDAYNEVLTSEIDDFSLFCDAFLGLFGVDADAETIAQMKESRVLILPPDSADARWITKSSSDAQTENILKRLHDSIYRVASCVDFSSETLMNGVSSGIAIRYKMSGQETRSAPIAAAMKKALQRRMEILCGLATLRYGEEVFRDIHIDFKRNIPEDTAATINLINALKGTVSDATLLSQLSFVEDVNAEIEAVEAQKQRNMALYSFGGGDEEEEE